MDLTAILGFGGRTRPPNPAILAVHPATLGGYKLIGMGSNRTKPADSIQACVLTRSWRRCCICFGLNRDLDVKQGQIAHLDKNRDNHAIDNLAFLCLPHHDQYDSVTSQSKSFRPAEGTFERTKDYSDVWDMMADVASHQYSEKEWKRYLPLFSEGTARTIDKLERVIMMFRDEISTIAKLAILRTNSQLCTESRVCQLVPRLAEEGQNSDSIFAERFRSVLRVLGELSRLADRGRDIQ